MELTLAKKKTTRYKKKVPKNINPTLWLIFSNPINPQWGLYELYLVDLIF